MVKNLPATQETQEMQVQALGGEDPLDSSILAWGTPWPKEPGGLQSKGVTKSWTRLSNCLREIATTSSLISFIHGKLCRQLLPLIGLFGGLKIATST